LEQTGKITGAGRKNQQAEAEREDQNTGAGDPDAGGTDRLTHTGGSEGWSRQGIRMLEQTEGTWRTEQTEGPAEDRGDWQVDADRRISRLEQKGKCWSLQVGPASYSKQGVLTAWSRWVD
jgi:hypothetical protein